MKDFRLFDIYDFLMDEDFIRWVKERKKEDNDFWNNWLTKHPDKHIIIAEARRIVESLGAEQKIINEAERGLEIERLLLTIKEQHHELQPENPAEAPVVAIKRNKNKKWWYAAAGVILVIGALSYFLINNKTDTAGKFAYANITTSRQLVENANTSGKPFSIKLPDGSVVELGAYSRIAYANNFDSADTRDVYLSGEAFFTVTKNPSKPFRVFAGEIVTKVLGTSFRVRSFENDSTIKVVVRTGKVSVYSQATTDIVKETASPNNLGGIILTPNQELVYQKALQKFQRILLGNPVMILPAEADKVLSYEDTSLDKVFAQLEENYGINIVYDNEALKKCTITADLRTVPFYEKLDLICKALGAKYEVIDGQVVIQAGGCE